MLVGGGGYTIRNVARCWTNETSVALGVEVANGKYSCNPYVMNKLSHLYHLDESILIFKGIGSIFIPFFDETSSSKQYISR